MCLAAGVRRRARRRMFEPEEGESPARGTYRICFDYFGSGASLGQRIHIAPCARI